MVEKAKTLLVQLTNVTFNTLLQYKEKTGLHSTMPTDEPIRRNSTTDTLPLHERLHNRATWVGSQHEYCICDTYVVDYYVRTCDVVLVRVVMIQNDIVESGSRQILYSSHQNRIIISNLYSYQFDRKCPPCTII